MPEDVMKKFLTIILSLYSLFSFAQGTAGEAAKFEYRSLIDMPTAGILEKGFVGATTDVLPNGVLVAKLEVGVFENISFGISYGAGNLIGSGSPNWYKLPGVNVRFRLFDESVTFPAISIGFDSQGKGEYFESSNRFAVKSPGFYGAAAKNFEFFGFMSVHGSVNYSLESKDGDNFLNFIGGVEKTIGKNVSIIAEYDFAFNDNTTDIYGRGNGYLNLGVRWSMAEGFTLGFDLRDLLDNKKWSPGSADRAIKIEYIKTIF
jgi:hypothetical protein